MRYLTLFTLFAALSWLPLAQGQATDNRQCSEAELDAILAQQAALDIVLAHSRDLPTLEGFVEYSQALMAWRDQDTSAVQRCAEGFQMARLMDQITSDSAALEALFVNGPVWDTPNAMPLRDGYELRKRLLEQFAAARDSGERPQAYPDDMIRYPACERYELEALLSNFKGYDILLEMAEGIAETDDLLAYAEAQVAWRDTIWEGAPTCELSWRLRFLMSRVSEDVLAWKGLEVAGIAAEANPYADIMPRNQDLLSALKTQTFYPQLERARADRNALLVRPLDMPDCPREVVESELAMLRSYLGAGEASIRTHEDLFAYSVEQINWRDEYLSSVPGCGQMLKARWLLLAFNSDFVARAALALMGVTAADNPYLNLPSDQARIESLGIVARDTAETAAMPGPDDRPRSCTPAERDAALSQGSAGFNELWRSISLIFTTDSLADFVEKLVAWRGSIWDEMPLCAEAIELALELHRRLNGYANLLALDFAGISRDLNPYREQITQDRAILQALTLALLRGETSSSPEEQPAESLPQCGNADTRTVFQSVTDQASDMLSVSVDSLDNLLAYNETQLKLRADGFAQTPICHEIFTMRVSLTQVMSDFVARTALDMAGVVADENPYQRLASDQDRLKQAGIDMLQRHSSRTPTIETPQARACSADERDALVGLTVDFQKRFRAVESDDAWTILLEHTGRILDWRLQGLPQFPPCAGGAEAALLMNEIAADFAVKLALAYAGISFEDIPQTDLVSSAYQQLLATMQQVAG